jgi:hypothetical protein
MFSFLYQCRIWQYIWVTRRVSYKKQEVLCPARAPGFTAGFLVGSVLLIFLVFCVVLLCVFTFWVPCCDVCIETLFGSSLPPVVCRRVMSYLLYLFLFAYSGVQYILCCIVLFSFSSSCVPCDAGFSGLSSFDCPFGIL